VSQKRKGGVLSVSDLSSRPKFCMVVRQGGVGSRLPGVLVLF
jgi:hypothetical protein